MAITNSRVFALYLEPSPDVVEAIHCEVLDIRPWRPQFMTALERQFEGEFRPPHYQFKIEYCTEGAGCKQTWVNDFSINLKE